MNPHVRFEDEADAEYRLAGRWYEDRREHLGLEFFDAIDATMIRSWRCRRLAQWLRECRPTCQFDAAL